MYYSAIVFITVAIMAVTIIHLYENETLSRQSKRRLRFIAILIIICATCEYAGNLLNGYSSECRIMHACIKAVELTIAPAISFAITKIVLTQKYEKIFKIFSISILSINNICAVVSIFVPFIFYVDENSFYEHRGFYWIYQTVNFIGIMLFISALLVYLKRYQGRNIATIFSTLIFLTIGLGLRILYGEIYIDWLVVAVTFLIFIIYYSDLALKADALTTLLNRKSYENRLKSLDYTTAIILIDANNFKLINDTYGHQCGDIILQVIAKAILKVYGKYGFCYRIGGDEFCIILKNGQLEKMAKIKETLNSAEVLETLTQHLKFTLQEKKKEYPMLKDGVSVGWAIYDGLYDISCKDDEENPYTLNSVKEVVGLADERMYADKQKYKNSKK